MKERERKKGRPLMLPSLNRMMENEDQPGMGSMPNGQQGQMKPNMVQENNKVRCGYILTIMS